MWNFFSRFDSWYSCHFRSSKNAHFFTCSRAIPVFAIPKSSKFLWLDLTSRLPKHFQWNEHGRRKKAISLSLVAWCSKQIELTTHVGVLSLPSVIIHPKFIHSIAVSNSWAFLAFLWIIQYSTVNQWHWSSDRIWENKTSRNSKNWKFETKKRSFCVCLFEITFGQVVLQLEASNLGNA